MNFATVMLQCLQYWVVCKGTTVVVDAFSTFWCSGRTHSRAEKEEKKPKLIWEGYKRRHKGEIPPKVGVERVLLALAQHTALTLPVLCAVHPSFVCNSHLVTPENKTAL